jgi:hypothetical protein
MTDLLKHVSEFPLASTVMGTCSIAGACLGLVSARQSAATLVQSVLGSLGAENETVHLWV